MTKDKKKTEGTAIFTTAISGRKSHQLLERLKKGENVTDSERLDVIQQILAFSPRDWSTDEELWLLYRVAFNKPGEE